MQIRSFSGLWLLSALVIGCADPRSEKPSDDVAPPFPAGQGQTKTPQRPYQPGPYGINKGATIQNFKFSGFHQPGTSSSTGALQDIELAEFWNPEGNGVYPEGHPLAGEPMPKALMIDVSAVWCSPCQFESRYILPGEHLKFNPRGGEFLLVLGDGGDPGTPPVAQELQNWVTKYKLLFPSVIDPSQKLGALFDQDAFPVNMVIDLKTMRIAEVIAGVPQKCDTSKTPWTNNVGGGYEFWQAYESLLDRPSSCAEDFAVEG